MLWVIARRRTTLCGLSAFRGPNSLIKEELNNGSLQPSASHTTPPETNRPVARTTAPTLNSSPVDVEMLCNLFLSWRAYQSSLRKRVSLRYNRIIVNAFLRRHRLRNAFVKAGSEGKFG